MRSLQSVQSNTETELEGSALERVRRMGVRLHTCLPEEPRGRGQKRGGDMKRRRLGVVATTRLGYGMVENSHCFWR